MHPARRAGNAHSLFLSFTLFCAALISQAFAGKDIKDRKARNFFLVLALLTAGIPFGIQTVQLQLQRESDEAATERHEEVKGEFPRTREEIAAELEKYRKDLMDEFPFGYVLFKPGGGSTITLTEDSKVGDVLIEIPPKFTSPQYLVGNGKAYFDFIMRFGRIAKPGQPGAGGIEFSVNTSLPLKKNAFVELNPKVFQEYQPVIKVVEDDPASPAFAIGLKKAKGSAPNAMIEIN